MFDIITFGSGTQDIFLKLAEENYRLLENGELLGFELGEKILVPEMHIESGGGGTNTAATFALQGLSVAWVGKVGCDRAGQNLAEELEELGVETEFIEYDPRHHTALSVILSPDGQDRTILLNKGACHFLDKTDIPWQAIKQAKWFYIAPLYQDIAVLQKIVDFANKNNIKAALNPSRQHLEQNQEELKSLVDKVDVLLLNQEEAELFLPRPPVPASPAGGRRAILGSGFADVLADVKHPQELEGRWRGERVSPFDGILVITKGEQGSVAYDGKDIVKGKAEKVEVVEQTGAGDAFGSGFVAGLLKGQSIKQALVLARKNATGCIQQLGAKKGLIRGH